MMAREALRMAVAAVTAALLAASISYWVLPELFTLPVWPSRPQATP